MSITQNMTIKRKLILIIMLTCTMALLLAGTLDLASQRAAIRKELIRSISCYAQIIGENCRAALSFEDAKDASETLKSLEVKSSIVFACVYTNEGKVLARYQRTDIEEDIPAPPCGKESYWFDSRYFKLFKQIGSGDEVIGTVHIQLDTSEIKAQLWQELGIKILFVLVCSIVACLVSLRLQRLISGPIVNLAEVSKVISEEKNYSIRAVKQNNDEVGSLIDAFNIMLEQIQQRESALTDARDQLETRVRERTAELTTSNQRLTGEIIERRKTEEELRKAEERFRQVVESAGDWIWEVNTQGLYTYASPIVERVLGYKSEEIVGKKHFYDFFDPGVKEDLKKAAFEVFAKRESFKGFVNPNMHKNSSSVIMETSGTPIIDEKGNLCGYRGADKDITEHKRAEEALKESERKFRAIFDNVNDGILLADTETKKFDTGNNTACRMLGYSLEEIKNLGVTDIHPKEDLPYVLEQFERQLRKEIALGNDLPVKKKDGSVFYADVNASSITLAGRTYLIGIFRDITERQQKEKELKKTHEELVSASRRAGMAEVAADVLHNVGNVLNSINVSTTLVTEKIAGSELANLEKLASLINDHIEDLGTFLTEHPQGKHIPVYLTEVSKCLQAEQSDIIGKLHVLADNVQHIKDIISMQQAYAKVSGVSVEVSPSQLVDDAIQINSAGLQRHGTRLVREFQELPNVEIDRQRVLQVLVNLVSNAKYALSGSDKEDKLLTIRIYRRSEDRFRIEVADNGVGITKENLTKVFSHGFTTKENGHGFGLHSSALAAKELGGSLTVHSDGLGKGAKFTLELPFKPARATL